MSISNSTASSRRSSEASIVLPNPKYKRIFESNANYSPLERIKANDVFKQELFSKLLKSINGTKWQNGSYFLTVGKQHKDGRFQEVFIDFFRGLRGADPLAVEASVSLANRFRGYSDVSRSEEHTIDCGDFSDIQTIHYSPTQEVIDELKQILEDEYGLQGPFIGVLNLAGRKIGSTFQADTRDTCFYEVPLVSRLFPRCVDTLREIFNSLLLTEWLKNDIEGVKLYLKENDYVDRPGPSKEDLILSIRLWEKAKYRGEEQKKCDVEIAKKHRNGLKDDISGIAISGGLSFITGNPSFVIGKAAQTMMNVIGNKVDPEGKDQAVQVLKLFGGAGLGGALGGNPWDLGTSLGIDLVGLATRGDKTGKGETALRNLGGSVLKGVLTSDRKKLICQILGGAVAEAANQIPETTEDTPLDVRIARALLTNSDVQAHYIKGYVDNIFKEDPKPKTGGIPTAEEQEMYPKQEPTLEDLQRQAEYEGQLSEYEQEQKAFAEWEAYQKNQELLDSAISSTDLEVQQAEKEMLKWWGKYQKKVGIFSYGSKEFNKYWKKRAIFEQKTNNLNGLKAQKGLPQVAPFQKFVRKPTKPKGFLGVLDRAYDKTCDVAKKIGLGPSEVTVGSVNLYEMKPSTVSDGRVPTYTPPQPQISQHTSNMGQWESVQAMQQQQMFERNMAYQSPPITTPSQPLSFGSGLANNVQMPPSDWSSLGRNPPEYRIPGVKHYPAGDRTQSNIPTWLRYFASGGETLDPQERIDRNTQVLVAHAKAVGQAFGEIADELRSFGCINAKFDQGKVTLRFDRTISSQIDGFMDQYLPNMDHVPNFRYVEFTARIANDVMLQSFMMPFFQAQRAKPLIDRVLVRPQGFSNQVRAIEAFQQPALRSGLSFPKLGLMPGQPTSLVERNISKIRTDWVFPKKGGATINGRWYTEHALERMAPRTPEVMAELEIRALNRAAKEGCLPQTKEFGKWMEKHRPDPRNVPPSVVEAEIAKPGSTSIRVELNNKGDVVTVMPGGKK